MTPTYLPTPQDAFASGAAARDAIREDFFRRLRDAMNVAIRRGETNVSVKFCGELWHAEQVEKELLAVGYKTLVTYDPVGHVSIGVNWRQP